MQRSFVHKVISLDERKIYMYKIVLKRVEQKPRKRITAVVVKPETYEKIDRICMETGMTIESLVDLLLTKALEDVELE